MRIVAPVAMIIFLILLPRSVYASDWYKGESCDHLTQSCLIASCEKSDVSPAQVYENNKGYSDDKLIDQGDDRVDVIAQGTLMIFYHTPESCQKFRNAELRANQQQEQKQKIEQEKLDKYR